MGFELVDVGALAPLGVDPLVEEVAAQVGIAGIAYRASSRRVQGWALARDATIAGIGVLFALWAAFAAGYQAVYLALLVVLAGVVVRAFYPAPYPRK